MLRNQAMMFHRCNLKKKKPVTLQNQFNQKEEFLKTRAINYIIIKNKFVIIKFRKAIIHNLLNPKGIQEEQGSDQYHIGKIKKFITKLG